MAIASDKLKDRTKDDLTDYAETLKKYIREDIFPYINGFRKLPKTKRIEAERVRETKEHLEKILKIEGKYGCGLFRLEMDEANENPGSSYCDKNYWWIFPIISDKKIYLRFLAEKALPKVFSNEKFSVRSTMIPCENDCSFDIM